MKQIFIFLSIILTLSARSEEKFLSNILNEKVASVYTCFYSPANKYIAGCDAMILELTNLENVTNASVILTMYSSIIPDLNNPYVAMDKNSFVCDLKGNDLVNYFKDKYTLNELRYKIYTLTSAKIYDIKVSRDVWQKFIKKINEKHQQYYLKHLPIAKKLVPWDQLEAMRDGLNLKEILLTLQYIDHEANAKMLKRYGDYGLSLTLDRLAAEILDYFFTKVILQNK